MTFQFPKKQIGNKIWFLTDQEIFKHGEIDLVTIAIRAGAVRIYYGVGVLIADGQNEYYTIEENQVMDGGPAIPTPKYRVGDQVEYSYTYEDDQTPMTRSAIAKIEKIEIHMYEGNQMELVYIMDDDADYWVDESDIVGFHDSVIEPLKETADEGTPV